MTWTQTFTGRQFWLLDPQLEDVCIEDIAHALALQCRFNGACLQFYSVAEHSVRVSRIVSPEYALDGLLHDAAEAYVGDIIAPLKRCLPDFGGIERHIMRCVCERFGLLWPIMPQVKAADRVMLATEARDLMAPHPAEWVPLPEPLIERIVPWTHVEAERRFMDRFHELAR